MPRLAEKLGDLKAQSRYRALSLPNGIDLTSNDYLGMAQHPDLRAAARAALDEGIDIGAAGSRLLRGHTQSHQSLEDFAAAHFNAERTLFFATGFQANYALLTTLPERHDIILYDSLVHASVRDGIQASHAQSFKFPHNDLNALEKILKKYAEKNCCIAVESLYSMDGDTAPLAEMYALAQRYGATLIVDEAHSTGIFGTQGKGLCWDIIRKNGYANLITLHTCGKAIGVAGGLVCASGEIIDTLINRARAFIYSTAPMPLQAFLVQKSLELLAGADGESRRQSLKTICIKAHKLFGGPGTHILPIIIGQDEQTLRIALSLQEKGYDIRAIRPPSVPEHTARLRLSLSNTLTSDVLQKFATALEQVMQKDGHE